MNLQPAIDVKNPELKSQDSFDESTWLARARLADSSAWAEIHKHFYPKIWSTVNQIVQNHSLTEDIVQEAFIKAFFKIKKFRGDSSLGTWLYRLALNHTFDTLRKLKRKKNQAHLVSIHEPFSPAFTIPSPQPSLHPNEQHDQQQAISQALQTLSPEHRAVVQLRLIQGFSTKETAQILKCKKGTVLSRLYYACQKLQPLLRHHYEQL